ncbi:MAG: response regulator [Pseudomonadota bacterium]
MRVLIVEQNADLGRIWSRFLHREGIEAELASDADAAVAALDSSSYDALVLQMGLPDAQALIVSDYATFRDPDLPIITVSSGDFFSGGAIFELVPNARTLLSMPPRLDDLVALIAHYARNRSDTTPTQQRRRSA